VPQFAAVTPPNDAAPKKLAIACAGGPAPGINSVIAAVTAAARASDVEVVGLQDGFRWVMEGRTDHTLSLTAENTSTIHFRGGSHLGISRANPTKDPKLMDATLATLAKLGVGMLVTIGGDDTATTASKLATASKGALRVVHVPKTIDNDLDLPAHISTFGFQTARHIGTELCESLLVDAKTTGRWYFVIAMGRKAGHLALGIGKAAGATITLIPEEYGKTVRLATVVDTLVGSILKRLAGGREDGVAVLAEGIVELLPEEDIAELASAERDAHGHIRIAEIDFGRIVKQAVQKRLKELGIKAPTIVSKDIGYELRCADPIPFDLEYTRDLGYSAARYVIDGGTEALVSIQDGKFVPMRFADIMDPATGRMRVRMVDITQGAYAIGRSFMVRLAKKDFDDAAQAAKLAAASGVSAESLRAALGSVLA
jgi:ATP-dependent phosphofructokinase / diphosphate-dependent phosphofructokinase